MPKLPINYAMPLEWPMFQLCGHPFRYAECEPLADMAGMIAHARQYNKHVGCVRSRVKTKFGVSEINAGSNHYSTFPNQSLSQGQSLELVAGSGIA